MVIHEQIKSIVHSRMVLQRSVKQTTTASSNNEEISVLHEANQYNVLVAFCNSLKTKYLWFFL